MSVQKKLRDRAGAKQREPVAGVPRAQLLGPGVVVRGAAVLLRVPAAVGLPPESSTLRGAEDGGEMAAGRPPYQPERHHAVEHATGAGAELPAGPVRGVAAHATCALSQAQLLRGVRLPALADAAGAGR